MGWNILCNGNLEIFIYLKNRNDMSWISMYMKNYILYVHEKLHFVLLCLKSWHQHEYDCDVTLLCQVQECFTLESALYLYVSVWILDTWKIPTCVIKSCVIKFLRLCFKCTQGNLFNYKSIPEYWNSNQLNQLLILVW